MTSILTPAFISNYYSPRANDGLLALLTLSYSKWGQTFRLCDEVADFVSNGNTFEKCWFHLQPPNDSGSDLSQSSLQIDNVHRKYLPYFREAQADEDRERVKCLLQIVLFSAPNDVVGFSEFSLYRLSYTERVLQATCQFADIGNKNVPEREMDRFHNPGLSKA